jgi:hypothetical protein
MTDAEILEYYARPGAMTAAGAQAGLLDGLPADLGGLVGAVQGLVIHEHLAGAYGVTLTPEQRETVHVRPAADLLAAIGEADGRPLGVARAPEGRIAGNCRMFTVLVVTMLRARGVPARARCGFGRYFGSGMFEDHWVCEVRDAGSGRWFLADAQLDAVQRDLFGIGFDILDVPREEFLVAGQAWARYRAGADPAAFGLSVLGQGGAWWIAANLIRDVAALRGREMLPWDAWGAMPGPDTEPGADLAGLLDRLAELTAGPEAPDAAFAELRDRYESDPRLRVPAAVRNVLRDRDEPA